MNNATFERFFAKPRFKVLTVQSIIVRQIKNGGYRQLRVVNKYISCDMVANHFNFLNAQHGLNAPAFDL